VDCFFHHAVPSVALCTGCRKPVCATCRSAEGTCPSCVLAARIEAARQSNMINGGIGPSASASPPPPPPPYTAPHRAAASVTVIPAGSLATVRPETRALVALSYPIWPLALLALLDAKGSHAVRRQAWQALAFNGGMWGFGALLGTIASIPIVNFGALALLPFILPVWIVASVIYAFRVWSGDDVNVPIVSDWVDARMPSQTATH
jgi:hypothetical protein